MNEWYFVFNSPTHFGVFRTGAPRYPEIFYKEFKYIVPIYGKESLNIYLFENIGRNVLINKLFDLESSVGKIFSKTPN